MSNIFRDPSEGVAARRADLLRRRRDELVMMPHAIRRVFVARRARAAAGVVIAITGSALLAIASQPTWAAFLAKGLPGISPAVLCTLLVAMWIVGLFAYVAARAVDEHRFAVAMSRLVLPGRDVDADVERLSHENPDQTARDMAHRLEVRSSALPVLAAGVALPVTALYVAAIVRAGGWPVIAAFETLVAEHANQLLAYGGVGAVLAIAMTKRSARVPVAAPMMLGAAITCAVIATIATLWLAPLALLMASVALVIRRLRIERELLQAEDPAAGSEMFTIRGFIRQLRTTASAVLTRVRKLRHRRLLIAASVAAAALGGARFVMNSYESGVQTERVSFNHESVPGTPTIVASGAKSMVEPLSDGRLRITLDLVDDTVLALPALAGLSSLPPLWLAGVRIRQIEGLGLTASLVGGTTQSAPIDGEILVTSSNCGPGERPFTLQVQGQPGHYVLEVEPALKLADCRF